MGKKNFVKKKKNILFYWLLKSYVLKFISCWGWVNGWLSIFIRFLRGIYFKYIRCYLKVYYIFVGRYMLIFWYYIII